VAVGAPAGGERCPHLDALAGHVTEFAKILTSLHGDRLGDWITAVEADDQPGLHSFANGLKRDYDAVLNGLTMPWEFRSRRRQRPRLKMIKRSHYDANRLSLSSAHRYPAVRT
jgi:transposase